MHAQPRAARPAEESLPADPAARQPAARPTWARLAEAFGVLFSPAMMAVVLRLRLMAPIDLPDPAMHTAFIVDPRGMYARYSAYFASTAGLREGARVGFLVPARLAYLAFGAVPGFFVLRYAFALIAVVPVYLLLRRLYGRPAGVVGILALLSSPVVITALGTDYPDSAVVCYVAGGIACLAMPASPRWRPAWLCAAGVLLTAAVWSHGVAAPLCAATIAGYVGVRIARERAGLIRDLGLLAGVAVAVTALLMAASAVLLGHGNFIATTWHAFRYLSQASQVAQWHSPSWRWAPYLAYLLVPPAVLAALAAAVVRSGRSVPTPVLMVGVIAAVQLVVFAWLQFFGTVQALEQHYFSSTLWAGSCLAFAMTIAELARPLGGRPVAQWIPPVVLLAVPLAYEADPHVPAFGWAPAGVVLVAAMIAIAVAARSVGRIEWAVAAAAASFVALAGLTAAVLVLTVAPIPRHAQPAGTLPASVDPPPAYASALGGSYGLLVDNYRIATQLPLVAGKAYQGEQLLLWWPVSNQGFPYREYAGMYRGLANSVQSDPPVVSHWDRRILSGRRAPEVMLLDSTAASFPTAIRGLHRYRPVLLRSVTLRSGPLVLHVWIIRLRVFYHPPRGAR
jgi:Dolichyl-phosphate-mannose-protein mannosyltransferase